MAKKAAAAPEEKKSEGLFAQLRRFKDYLELSRAELRKVTWPTLKETKTTGLAVLAFVLVMAAFLGLVDLGLSKLISLVLAA